MFYYVPKVRNKYIKFVNMVDNDIKNNDYNHSMGEVIQAYSGLIRVLSYANTPILKTEVTKMGDIEVTVKLHNNTPHIFQVSNLAWFGTSAAAITDRELIFGELYHNFSNRKYFNNTANALSGIKNVYADVKNIDDPAVRLSYLRSLNGEKVFELSKREYANVNNTSSIGFAQSLLMSAFFEINGKTFAMDMERMAYQLEALFQLDKNFSSHAEPGQYVTSKSNAIFKFQNQVDECLSGLSGVKMIQTHRQEASQLIDGLNDNSTLEEMVTVTEMYAYDTVMATKLMDEPLNAPMDTNN